MEENKTVTERFEDYLKERERSGNTLQYYLRIAREFLSFAGERPLTKPLVIDYKESLIKSGIRSGPIFRTRTGRPLSRVYIWSEMKKLARRAGVSLGKVFPHNLRKLFARRFYELKKDVAKLADILGHSNINTTRIYLRTTAEEHRKDMESMDLVT